MNRTSLKTVREEAAKTIIDLKEGKVSPLIADAIYKQSLTIVESYRLELKAIELAINSSKRLDFKSASALIDKQEIIINLPKSTN